MVHSFFLQILAIAIKILPGALENQEIAINNLLYKCPVAKLGSKAGNFLSGKRGRERGEPLKIFNLNVRQ